MAEAYGARRDNLPAPGEELGPLKVASSATEGLGATSVELVANGSGIAGVHTGSIPEAFGKAVAQLRSISVVEEEPAKCAVMSASAESGVQTTLMSSLNSLWNNIHIVKDGGTAILLAECRDGIGGGALQMMVEGRLGTEPPSQLQYVEGLEHLVFAAELRQKYELGLVSTLPKYYSSSRLGYTAYSGMNDVLQKLPDKVGKSYRAIVLSDADIVMLKPKV
jgi:nickel-dependent lactate racemase